MNIFYVKRACMALLMATAVSAGPLHAGWFDTFKTQASSFIQDQLKPALKKPETYLFTAAALAGSYFGGRELYWGFRSALPLDRARDYVRSGVAKTVGNNDAVGALQNIIMNESQQHLTVDRLIPKAELDRLVRGHTDRYEFGRHVQVERVHDWMCGDVPITDHSLYVASQTGENCGYHAVPNAHIIEKILNFSNDDEFTLHCTQLRSGPDISAAKTAIGQEYGTAQSNTSFENISDEAITHLLELNGAEKDVTVIASPESPPELLGSAICGLRDAVEALRNGTKTCHAFILGDAKPAPKDVDLSRPLSELVSLSCGHWVAAIARMVQGCMEVHVADSIPGRIAQRKKAIEKLINILRYDPNQHVPPSCSWQSIASSSSSVSSRLIDSNEQLPDADYLCTIGENEYTAEQLITGLKRGDLNGDTVVHVAYFERSLKEFCELYIRRFSDEQVAYLEQCGVITKQSSFCTIL